MWKIFQSVSVQRSCRLTFATHYACRNTDLNLIPVAAMTSGFAAFKIISSFVELRDILDLTWLISNRSRWMSFFRSWYRKKQKERAMLPLLLALHFAWFIVDVIYLLQNLQILFVANLKILLKNVWFYGRGRVKCLQRVTVCYQSPPLGLPRGRAF